MTTVEKVWWYTVIAIIAGFASVGIYLLAAPKHIVRYELGGQYNNGVPEIHVDIENAADETIQLSKDVTWPSAVRMVDSLNTGLAKHPIR
jgi:hypothetical protein